MTIPSLGGNGGNSLNKIHINPVPEINPALQIQQSDVSPCCSTRASSACG